MSTQVTPPTAQEFLAFISDVAEVVAQHVQPKATQPAVVPVSATLAEPVAETADSFFLDEEKVAWDWPDIGGRAIEDLR